MTGRDNMPLTYDIPVGVSWLSLRALRTYKLYEAVHNKFAAIQLYPSKSNTRSEAPEAANAPTTINKRATTTPTEMSLP